MRPCAGQHGAATRRTADEPGRAPDGTGYGRAGRLPRDIDLRRSRTRSPAHVSAPRCPGRSRCLRAASFPPAAPGPRRQAGCSRSASRPRPVREGPTWTYREPAAPGWRTGPPPALRRSGPGRCSGSRPPSAHRSPRLRGHRLPPRRSWPRSAGRPRRGHPAGPPSGSRRMARCEPRSPRRPQRSRRSRPWPPRSRRARRRPCPESPGRSAAGRARRRHGRAGPAGPGSRAGGRRPTTRRQPPDPATPTASLLRRRCPGRQKRSRLAAGMALPRPVPR